MLFLDQPAGVGLSYTTLVSMNPLNFTDLRRDTRKWSCSGRCRCNRNIFYGRYRGHLRDDSERGRTRVGVFAVIISVCLQAPDNRAWITEFPQYNPQEAGFHLFCERYYLCPGDHADRKLWRTLRTVSTHEKFLNVEESLRTSFNRTNLSKIVPFTALKFHWQHLESVTDCHSSPQLC